MTSLPAIAPTVLFGGTVSFGTLVDRLHAQFPAHTRAKVTEIVLAEYEAMTGGIPIAVPAAVELGAVEMLQQRPRLRAVDND